MERLEGQPDGGVSCCCDLPEQRPGRILLALVAQLCANTRAAAAAAAAMKMSACNSPCTGELAAAAEMFLVAVIHM
jgi:hypothetical protein